MEKIDYTPKVVQVIYCSSNDEVEFTLSPPVYGRYLVIFVPENNYKD